MAIFLPSLGTLLVPKKIVKYQATRYSLYSPKSSIAASASMIPNLTNQPPAVDFIENRLPKYSPAFNDPPVHYSTSSKKFVSNAVIVAPRDNSEKTTCTQAMVYWRSIFPDSLTKFKATVEPRIRKPELSIREDGGWDKIYDKLYQARSSYTSQGGTFGQTVRWIADHATGVSVLVTTAQGIAPSNPYSTPVLGAVQLILNALKSSANIRAEALGAFDNLVPVFCEAEIFLSTFPNSSSVRNAAVELTVAVLQAVEAAIAFFSSSQLRRAFRSLLNGSAYLKDFQNIFQSIKDKSNDLQNQAHTAHIQSTEQFQRDATEMMNTLLALFNDHTKAKLALQKMKKRKVPLELETSILYARSSSPRSCLLDELESNTPEKYLDQWELQKLLNAPDMNIDLDFIASRKSQIPDREIVQAEQIINHAKFHAWMRSANSAKLLILWNRRSPKTSAGITPMSIFCTSLVPMIRGHSQFICLVWFCGLHTDSKNPNAWEMMASFINQLCQQTSFDFTTFGDNSLDEDLLPQDYDLDKLFKILYWLIQQLPIDITVVFLIDETYIYERDDFTTEFSIFDDIFGLIGDPDIDTVLKLLFTGTKAIGKLRSEFESKGQIIKVEELPHQIGAPSKDRMSRQIQHAFN